MKRTDRTKPLDLGAEGEPANALDSAFGERRSAPPKFDRLGTALDDAAPFDIGAVRPANPSERTQVSAAERRDLTPQLGPQPAPAKAGNQIYIVATLVSIVWAAAPIAFFVGYTRDVQPLANDPFAVAVLALLAAGPIALVFVAAFLLNQGARLAGEARFARAQAQDMIRPAAIAARGTEDIVQVIRREIESAVNAAAQARHELSTLREVLAAETAKLVEAAEGSSRSATALTQVLGAERQELANLSTALGGQVTNVEEALTRQARMVAEASDLAETQIREAEAALAARAADLAAAASDATEAAKIAGEDLARQAARLEAAGTGVSDQIRTVEEALAEQRAALVAVSHGLRAEQEDFGAQIETQQAQLAEILGRAREGASEMEAAAGRSGEAVEGLVAQALQHVQGLSDAAKEERDLFGNSTLQSLSALSEAGRQERAALQDEAARALDALTQAAAEARESTQAQAEATRAKIDQLTEAAHRAGETADGVFEKRMADARALIEQSVTLVEDAGARTSERLMEGLASARSAVEQLEGLLKQVDDRASRLPADAQARSDEVKTVVEQGVEQLLNAARHAADEANAIDAAFQERMRRNYEVLSESVRLMGVVGGASVGPRTSQYSPRNAPAPSGDSPVRETSSPDPEARPQEANAAEQAGLRPRLKFTPEAEPEVARANEQALYDDPAAGKATDDEFGWVFDAASGRTPLVDTAPAARAAARLADGDEEWTWRELLSSVDGESETAPAAPTAEAMAAEILSLGIDPSALLPRSRVEEFAGAIAAGDLHGGREGVRAIAPAAMRRLSRRVLTDPALRAAAGQFIRDFSANITRTPDRDGLTALIGSEAGRTWLLLDAALGDLA